jgi:hypothetical protein
MKKYIERELAIQQLELRLTMHKLCEDSDYKRGQIDGRIENINYLKDQSAADVEPVRHGEWNTSDTPLGRCCVCSICGSCPTMEYKYCPYCGAKMDGGKE